MKDEVIKRLKSIDREGMDKLIIYMEEIGFFTAPASTRFHGAYEGGLLVHCKKVYNIFNALTKKFNLKISDESKLICAFCHDLCKAGAYIKNNFGYRWNNEHPKGHALLSLKRIKNFIQLTEEEEQIIKFHMGMYGTFEFKERSGEYSMVELVDTYNKNKLAKLFYFCDDMSSQFLEKKNQ